MKNNTLKLNVVALALLVASPVIGFAAAPTSGAYITDTTDQYVEDQASQILSQANNILCFMGAMNPSDSKVIGSGSYVAMVDQKLCNSNSGGGKGNGSGATYQKAVVDATQATGAALIAKVWIDMPQSTINAKVSASQSPSTTNPYGVFSLNYCGTLPASVAGSCDVEKGFITAASTGLTYYANRKDNYSGTAVTQTDALTLNAATTDTGSGALTESVTGGTVSSMAISFAYNATHFLRSDDAGATTKCFDRALANADKSAWSYGLYDSTGAHVDRNSGFPVEYTDPTTNTVVNGYIGFWGFWSQTGTTPASGTAVSQLVYGNGAAPTKTSYTLLQSGGKLMKHTVANKTLADVNKQHFWFYAATNVPATGTAVMAANSQYELYWDNAVGQFKVYGKQNATTFNMEPLATPVAIANADMTAAASWGLNAWTNSGQWSVSSAAMATLSSTTAVLVVSDDIVYPDAYAAIGTLKCISDCPTPTAAAGTATFALLNYGTPWCVTGAGASCATTPAASVLSYTLNATTGNLLDGTGAAVLNKTATSQWSSAFNTQGSGKLIDSTKFATLAGTGTAGAFKASDLDAATTYYTWVSSTNSWDQLSVLMSGTTPVKFDAPLSVDFVVPANVAGTSKPYGNYAGAPITLDYNGFGDLQGIPSTCIDLTTNAPCAFTAAMTTTPTTWSWKPDFEIPFNGTLGVVTATVAGVTTTYYVKPLNEEVRFKYVGATCPFTLTLPATTPGLPQASGWTDPAIGAEPTPANTAPRVIQGVVKY